MMVKEGWPTGKAPVSKTGDCDSRRGSIPRPSARKAGGTVTLRVANPWTRIAGAGSTPAPSAVFGSEEAK